jgi:hypothetical protein
VRLVIDDVPRDLFRDLDHRRLREYRARALHFHLDVRRPVRRASTADGGRRPPRSLEEEATAFLTEAWQPTSGDIDRDRLVRLAQEYLAQAGTDAETSLLDPTPED